ncbi:MAG TPA: class I SAM-dependent rRNA methyltransferase [Stellaceae bacterium]|nr:class I SAM-dependent rRNA methyltransferase [Stellaceae bacterium]
MSDDPAARPAITLEPGHHKRAASGHPWVYSNELRMDAAAKALPRGSLVTVKDASGRALGVATFNANALIAARILDTDAKRAIDRDFFAARIERALALRRRLYDEPFYRLIHAEADGLPGLVIDRYGDVAAAQLNTAGMVALEGEIVHALEATLGAKAIVLRNDATSRAVEGLAEETRVALGTLEGPVELAENGAVFLADLIGGQKTGWFFDQRENRRFVARLSAGGRVLDAYCYGGGFAIQAALRGADRVLGIDRSEPALALAAQAAERNSVGERCRFARGEAFAELARLGASHERFDVVIADPPAFVRTRKDLGPGLRGYRKLARLASALVAPGGVLFLASCSHNVSPEDFAESVRRGLGDAERTGRIIRASGAAPDHPVHPALPESAYLKALALVLD